MKTKPNIIFILMDDLGKEWVSCYGAGDIETPNIDGLAASGIRFENVYSMPQCILAMGGQNNAKVSDRGVENEWVFRDRVVRDERYKLYVGTDQSPQKIRTADPHLARPGCGSHLHPTTAPALG